MDSDIRNECVGGQTHTIFEGTSEIQQLVIARAISGLRVAIKPGINWAREARRYSRRMLRLPHHREV